MLIQSRVHVLLEMQNVVLIAEVASWGELHIMGAACCHWTVVAKELKVAEMSLSSSLHVWLLLLLLLLLLQLVVVHAGWWWAGVVLQGVVKLVTCWWSSDGGRGHRRPRNCGPVNTVGQLHISPLFNYRQISLSDYMHNYGQTIWHTLWCH